jgi:hypothetical protein
LRAEREVATKRLHASLVRPREANADLAATEACVMVARAKNKALRHEFTRAQSQLIQTRVTSRPRALTWSTSSNRSTDAIVGMYQGEDPGLAAFGSFLFSASAEDLIRRQDAIGGMAKLDARRRRTASSLVLADVSVAAASNGTGSKDETRCSGLRRRTSERFGHPAG